MDVFQHKIDIPEASKGPPLPSDIEYTQSTSESDRWIDSESVRRSSSTNCPIRHWMSDQFHLPEDNQLVDDKDRDLYDRVHRMNLIASWLTGTPPIAMYPLTLNRYSSEFKSYLSKEMQKAQEATFQPQSDGEVTSNKGVDGPDETEGPEKDDHDDVEDRKVTHGGNDGGGGGDGGDGGIEITKKDYRITKKILDELVEIEALAKIPLHVKSRSALSDYNALSTLYESFIHKVLRDESVEEGTKGTVSKELMEHAFISGVLRTTSLLTRRSSELECNRYYRQQSTAYGRIIGVDRTEQKDLSIESIYSSSQDTIEWE